MFYWFFYFVQCSPHPFVYCCGSEDGEADVHLIVETVLHHLNHGIISIIAFTKIRVHLSVSATEAAFIVF